MEKRALMRLSAGFLLLLLLLSSCAGTGESFTVLRANVLFRGGEDAEATYRYLQARQLDGRWQDWIDYNLGSLYLSLGEIKAGIRVLSRAAEGYTLLPQQPGRWDRELFFRCHFNLGVAHYENGGYRDAAASFLQALRLQPDSWDAKINLELSLEALARATIGSRIQSGRSSEPREEPDAEGEELLQSIHREERPAWLSAPAARRYEKDW